MNFIYESKKMKQMSLIMLISASAILFPMQPASAWYSVKDEESIAKLTEILKETQDTKLAIADQIGAMLKDMGVIDEETYKKFSTQLQRLDGFISKTLYDVDTFPESIIFGSSGTDVIEITGINGQKIKVPINKESDTSKVLASCIPAIGISNADGTKDVGLSAKQKAYISAVGYLMKSNRHTLTLYNKLNAYLLQYQQQLDQLMIDNGKIKNGSVEAQQISNQISYVRGRVEQIRSAMTALDSQQSIVRAHVEAQQKVNEDIAAEAQKAQTEQSVQVSADNVKNSAETKASNESYREYMKSLGR